jgi:two-component system, OmpR family, response regulator
MRMEPHILFADDNSDICELVQTLLQTAGFRVSTSDNAADVLQRVATESFEALILDYWMQEATGIDLCRQIRTFDQSTPILICSGAITQADKEAGVLAGAQGYIGKPFNSADLIGALHWLLKASAADSAFTNG